MIMNFSANLFSVIIQIENLNRLTKSMEDTFFVFVIFNQSTHGLDNPPFVSTNSSISDPHDAPTQANL